MDKIGPMGWGNPTLTTDRNLYHERVSYELMCDNNPERISMAYAREETAIEKKIRSRFQFDSGYLFTEAEKLLYGSDIHVNQSEYGSIGSCVGTSHCTLVCSRIAQEILVEGQREDLFGQLNTNTDSVIPYIPYSYGVGRVLIGGGTRGDGSYCSWQINGSLQWGYLPCSTPGLAGPYPQTQSSNCRNFGSNKTLLLKYTNIAKQYLLTDTRRINTGEELKQAIIIEKAPVQICSSWGFAYWTDKDGLKLYKPSGSWAHSLSLIGVFEINKNWYAAVRNSWGRDAHKLNPGAGVPDGCFIITLETADKWLKDAQAQTIGEIQGMTLDIPSFQI